MFRIGFDMDGTLCEGIPHKSRIDYSQHSTYKGLGPKDEDTCRIYNALVRIPGVEAYIISARSHPAAAAQISNWLFSYNMREPDGILCRKTPEMNHHSYKNLLARALQLDLHIDDCPETADTLAKHSDTKVLLMQSECWPGSTGGIASWEALYPLILKEINANQQPNALP